MIPSYLTRDEIIQRASQIDVIAAVEAILIEAANGKAGLAVRQELIPAGMSGLMGIMPGYRATAPARFCAKLVCVMPQNPAKGLPAHQGLCVLYDGSDGHVIGLAEAGAVTEIRTAAMAALATLRLAARHDHMLFIGSGHQVLPHIEAFARLFPQAHFLLWARNSASAGLIIKEAAQKGIAVDFAPDLQMAVVKADVVTTLTGARSPILQAECLAAGSHINAMGSSTPFVKEFGPDLIARAQIYVDHADSVLQLAGEFSALTVMPDVMELGAHLAADLPNPKGAKDCTLFKSVGTALQDLALMDKLFEEFK